MTYYTRISYYDGPTDIEQHETQEDAATAYQQAIEARQDAGISGFGDCSRISWGRIKAGKMQPINAREF